MPMPFSLVRSHGGLVYVSGTVGCDANGAVPGDFEAQVRLALDELRRLLESEGASMATVLKTTVFLTDANDVEAMNAVYLEYFDDPLPVRSTIVTGLLDPAWRFEIEAHAAVEPVGAPS